MSISTARAASSSRVFRAEPASSFHARAAVSAVKGRIGSRATSSASFSLNSILRISKSRGEGGAPWGNRFRRSTRLR